MKSKADYLVYPTQSFDYPSPSAPTTEQIQTQPDATVSPPVAAPQVEALQVEAPQEFWFTVCKYYILIVNGMACGLIALLVVIITIMRLVGLFRGNVAAFFVGLILIALVGLISLYFYFVPIQGVRQGLPKRLGVHGVLCGVYAFGLLASVTDTRASTDDTIFGQFVQVYTSNLSVFTRLIFNILEVIACFVMVNQLNQRRKIPPLASNA